MYQICDADGDCDHTIATITVVPVDDMPDAVDDMVTATEDTPLNIDPLPNDDFGGDYRACTPITIVTLRVMVRRRWTTTVRPTIRRMIRSIIRRIPITTVPDQIVYEICDADGDCDQATIDITVDPVNDVPDAVDDPNETTDEDTPVNIDVLA
ncbi:MAG: hypothetical protein H6559_32460 [Lewinellaceae bacterium]|nr:hypothetical protein [Lewinellaceae bacterium]